jgi:glycosyltransferase involved in cell wall biosynthesis
MSEENKKKIAIVHAFFDQLGGAEKIALILAKELKADLITTNLNKKKLSKFGFENINIKEIGEINKYWPEKQLESLDFFKKCDLKEYDLLIITSEWSLTAIRKNIPSIWYVNSIPETLYKKNKLDKELNYIKKNIEKNINKLNLIIANSNKTQRCLVEKMKKDSILIYPPVNIDEYYFKNPENYWLSINRIDYYKNIELQIKAFNLMPNENLIIVGEPEDTINSKKYFEYLKNNSPENINFVGSKFGTELKELLSKSKGLIATAKNEFFGLTPIEAMASGKPTIAIKQGGYKETINNETGVLIEPEAYELVKAVENINKRIETYKENCLKEAKKYSLKKFIEKINIVIKDLK